MLCSKIKICCSPFTIVYAVYMYKNKSRIGRISSTDPNLQTIPIRTPEGKRIREGFVAPATVRWFDVDYSQIELRILAHLSGDPGLRSAFVDDVEPPPHRGRGVRGAEGH